MGSLRITGLLALAIGGPGAVGLTLYTGRRNPSALLMAVFAIWVLAPFAALAAADAMSKAWSAVTRTALYVLMILTAFVTLGVYGYVAFGPSRPQPAFWFLIVPPGSVLLAAVVLRGAAAVSSSRTTSNGK